MDPYLENPAIWPDFHVTFLVSFREVLNKALPPNYVARIDRYVWVDDAEGEELRLVAKPDAFVSDPLAREASAPSAVLAAPATVTLPAPGRKGKAYLRIIDHESHRVVTVVELLSPSNKRPGKDRDAYLLKREEYLESPVHFVEIDLLRSGLRPPVQGPVPPADYYVIVSTTSDRPRAGVWHFRLRDPLPTIPVPLAGNDRPALLSLRDAFGRAYDLGGYAREVDYSRPAEPPLGASDAAWAEQLLQQSRREPRV
jgi:hypothetical protein